MNTYRTPVWIKTVFIVFVLFGSIVLIDTIKSERRIDQDRDYQDCISYQIYTGERSHRDAVAICEPKRP